MNVDLATAAAWAVPFVPFGAAAAWAAWYKRTPKGCAAAALAAAQLPFTYRVRDADSSGPVLRVRVDTPQSVSAWAGKAEQIASAFGRPHAHVEAVDGGVELFMLQHARTVWDALPKWESATPDSVPVLRSVPVARDAYGRPWRAPVLGAHWLVIGATGSGKGSVIWSAVQQLASGVRDGTVQLWGVDPKGGVELGFAEQMFHRVVFNGADPTVWEADLASLLNDAREAMDTRLERMRGTSRLHEPTRSEPLIVVIVDEFLTLTLGIADRAVRQSIERDLTMLLSKGRAAGVAVIACAQLAQKDALSANLRDLFPLRVGLRMTDPVQVDMTLGADARKSGASCHTIPDSHPGVAYVIGETGAPRLVRFPWVPDDAVRAMAVKFTPPSLAPMPTPTRPLPPAPDDVEDGTPQKQEPSKGEVLRALIVEHPSWSQTQLAEAAGVSRRTVGRVVKEMEADAAVPATHTSAPAVLGP